ncbi:MAG: hypothetical protein JRD89_15875, partial [Deltaproteobacteria bacterium]|nr:hypothetical protein [Deltaproteobacteria bacterium]
MRRVLLEVVMEADVRCPRCAKLEKLLRRICDELGVSFAVKYLGNRSVAAHEESIVTHTFSKEWVERYGLEEHRKALKRIEPVLNFFQKIGAQAFPTVIIRWHDGVRTKEIVVRGFDPDAPEAKQFL